MQYISKASLLLGVCYLTGCVAIDSRVGQLAAKPFPLGGATVTFANQPIYTSKKGFFKAATDFADVVGLYAYRGRPRADLIALRWVDNVGLTLRMTREDKVLFEKTYRWGEEMEIMEGGRILLQPKHDLHSGGGSALIYERKQVMVFIDDDDNLVVVETSNALGVFLIVPIPGQWQLVSIFPRVT